MHRPHLDTTTQTAITPPLGKMRSVGETLSLPRQSIEVDIQQNTGKLRIFNLYPNDHVLTVNVEDENAVEVCNTLCEAALGSMENYFNTELQQIMGMSSLSYSRN
jgi:hypothetical protein